MGGHGSGRSATQTLTDHDRSIDLAALMRVGTANRSLSWSTGGRVVSSILSTLSARFSTRRAHRSCRGDRQPSRWKARRRCLEVFGAGFSAAAGSGAG